MNTPESQPNDNDFFDDTPDPFVKLIIVKVKGPSDPATIRPIRPGIYREWPRPQLPPTPPPEPPQP